jgi:hypothetical protein
MFTGLLLNKMFTPSQYLSIPVCARCGRILDDCECKVRKMIDCVYPDDCGCGDCASLKNTEEFLQCNNCTLYMPECICKSSSIIN